MHSRSTDLPDLTGRTMIVTGASSGLGAAASRELAKAGARVVLAVRDTAKGRRVADAIAGDTEVWQLDLADLRSVRAFAAACTGKIDVLINNAGIMRVPEARTPDGFELQIGTNHLGPFALTNLLLPQIVGRVVTVSSILHARGQLDLDDLNWERRRYRPAQAYCDSKLANLLFTCDLQRRLTEVGSGVLAVAAHPGVTRTNLLGHIGGIRGALNKTIGPFVVQDVTRGVLPLLYAATGDVFAGCYVGPDGIGGLRGNPTFVKRAKVADDPDLARRLWDLSVELTAA